MIKKTKKPKKMLWIFSTLLPLMGLMGMALYQKLNEPLMLFVPLFFIYIVIPVLDFIFSTDESNPSVEEVVELEKSTFYNWVLYLMLPIHFFVFFYTIFFVVNQPLELWMQGIIILI